MTHVNLKQSEGAKYSRIYAMGAARGDLTVTNDDIAGPIESSDEWIRQRTGVITRKRASKNITAADLARGQFKPRNPALKAEVQAYLHALEATGQRQLVVWPVHCVLGTWGHNIHAERQPYAHWRKSFGPNWLWWSGFQVHLLQGVTVADLEGVKTQRLRLNPGAAALVAACQKAGLKVLLVSGGFTYFAEHVCALLAIDFMRSNALEIEGGALTGGLIQQSWGEICDGAEKRRTLLEVASLMNIRPEQCIAMGDGANDLPMMGAAGLSVAYHAKPAVRAQAQVAINEGGLDRLLEVLAD